MPRWSFIHFGIYATPLLIQTFHILHPFDRKKRFLLIVAFLAVSDEIVLGASATPGQRNDMVHGQIFRLKKLGTGLVGVAGAARRRKKNQV